MPTEADSILNAIADEVDGMVTEFVVIASFIDPEGGSHIYTCAPDGQRCHTTLGLLDFGQAIERRKAAAAWDDDCEDDDG